MEGSPAAVVAAHVGLVRRYFARRCARAEDAEDLAQEAVCALLSGWARFRGDAQPSTWVYAVCRNVYSDWAYRQNRRRETELTPALEPAAPDTPPTGLDAAVERLTTAERRLWELYYVRGQRVGQVARTLAVPEGTAKYHLSRLRSRLRELLGAPW